MGPAGRERRCFGRGTPIRVCSAEASRGSGPKRNFVVRIGGEDVMLKVYLDDRHAVLRF